MSEQKSTHNDNVGNRTTNHVGAFIIVCAALLMFSGVSSNISHKAAVKEKEAKAVQKELENAQKEQEEIAEQQEIEDAKIKTIASIPSETMDKLIKYVGDDAEAKCATGSSAVSNIFCDAIDNKYKGSYRRENATFAFSISSWTRESADKDFTNPQSTKPLFKVYFKSSFK